MARHLVATGQLIDEDPAEALAHAMAARRLASRIAAVREAVGLAAYHAGEWQTAIAELRTYHRMSGVQSHLAVLADCERALGRPERAIDLFRGAEQEKLEAAVAIELLIVAAGARGDLGQRDAAVAMLQVPELTTDTAQPWTARLRYAYADALLAVDRRAEAREWFSRAAEVDAEAETDAAERLLELDGVVIEGDDEDEATEELVAGPGTPGAVPARPDSELTEDGRPDDVDTAEDAVDDVAGVEDEHTDDVDAVSDDRADNDAIEDEDAVGDDRVVAVEAESRGDEVVQADAVTASDAAATSGAVTASDVPAASGVGESSPADGERSGDSETERR
ncbi:MULTISPECIES: lipopolysaccharide assembly protein LapB [unclassified Micromonospora]|uniref:tetratricopeptide repeat protein n=1 Tax=unclassified Micromonospora TaxID=2617518 RepID=UPI001F34FB62|nr:MULTISPECIES: MSCRAMM family adhesin SdrC [unclassified Micromonospora]